MYRPADVLSASLAGGGSQNSVEHVSLTPAGQSVLIHWIGTLILASLPFSKAV